MADECMVIQLGECAPISVLALRSMHVWLRAIDCESEGIVPGRVCTIKFGLYIHIRRHTCTLIWYAMPYHVLSVIIPVPVQLLRQAGSRG